MHVKSKSDVEQLEAGEPREPARSRKAEQSLETRSALIAAARDLFAARGYADVGTEEIVRAAVGASVTRFLDALRPRA